MLGSWVLLVYRVKCCCESVVQSGAAGVLGAGQSGAAGVQELSAAGVQGSSAARPSGSYASAVLGNGSDTSFEVTHKGNVNIGCIRRMHKAKRQIADEKWLILHTNVN